MGLLYCLCFFLDIFYFRILSLCCLYFPFSLYFISILFSCVCLINAILVYSIFLLLAYVAICFYFSHCLLPITLTNLVTLFLSYSVYCLRRVLVITYFYSCSCCWYYCALSSVYSTLCYLFVRNFCTRSFSFFPVFSAGCKFLYFSILHFLIFNFLRCCPIFILCLLCYCCCC